MSLILPGLPVAIGWRGADYCAEARALFARFTVKPTGTQKRAMDRLIRALKSAGVWSKLDVLYVMACHDAQAAQRNWIGDSFNLTPINSPTFTAKQGYAGNGSSSYLATGYAPGVSAGVAAQNSFHLGAWTQSESATSAVDVGNTNCSINAWSGTNWTGRSMNASTASVFATTATAIGHHMHTRAASGTVSGYRNGSLDSSQSATSSTPVSAELFIGARNNAGTPASFTARRQSIIHSGGHLTATEISAKYAAFSAYLAAIA